MSAPYFAVGCVAAAYLIGTAAQAQTTTYDYTGASMSGTESGPLGPDLNQATLPYCCAMLNGTITLTSPLAPDLVDTAVTPLSATFTLLGITAGGPLDPDNPVLQFGTGANSTNHALFGTTIDFSTNGAGQITAWDLQLQTSSSSSVAGWTASSTAAGDTGVENAVNQHGVSYDVSNSVAGDWTLAGGSSAESVPEIDPRGALPALTMLLVF